jgi:hypothetical protein
MTLKAAASGAYFEWRPGGQTEGGSAAACGMILSGLLEVIRKLWPENTVGCL